MKRFSLFSFRRCILAALVLMLALPWAVFADYVVNNIDTTIDPELETVTIAAGGSTTVGYYIYETTGGGDASGCNATGANPATVNLSVPAGVTASASSLNMIGCGTSAARYVSFSSSTPGSYLISVASVTGGKLNSLWDSAPAAFTLIVTSLPPTDTTPPVVNVSFLTPDGQNDWFVTSPVVGTVTANDTTTGGSNITAITCTGATVGTITGLGTPSASAPLTVSAQGVNNVSCTATDSATNSGAGPCSINTAEIKIDTVAPAVSLNPAADSCDTPGNAGWCRGMQTAGFSASDDTSGVASPCTGASCNFTQSTSTNGSAVNIASGQVCDSAGNCNSGISAGPYKIDSVAPTGVSGAPDRSPDHNGWYNQPVNIVFTGTDATSLIGSCTTVNYSGPDGSGLTVDGTCTDVAGNTSTPIPSSPFDYDATAPTVAFTTPPGGSPYFLNQLVIPSYTCSDNLSGFAGGNSVSGPAAGCSGPATVDTSSVGPKSYSVTATDLAGNSASPSVSYSVIYNWNGFFRPVDNLPTLNVAKAGSAIPVKFSLSGYQGLNIFAAGYPKSVPISCDSTAPVDGIEETVTAGGSSLNYDSSANQYVYVWKTEKAWAGTCRQLVVQLDDLTFHRANFSFTK